MSTFFSKHFFPNLSKLRSYLYTNIPHDLWLKAIEIYTLNWFILDLINLLFSKLGLENNHFFFFFFLRSFSSNCRNCYGYYCCSSICNISNGIPWNAFLLKECIWWNNEKYSEENWHRSLNGYYSHGFNILRLLILYRIFFSPQVKWSMIFSNKHGIHELPHELPNNFRLRTFGN